MRKESEVSTIKPGPTQKEVLKFGENLVDMDYLKSFETALHLLDTDMAKLRIDIVNGIENAIVVRLSNNEQLFMTDNPDEIDFFKHPKKGLQFIAEVIEKSPL